MDIAELRRKANEEKTKSGQPQQGVPPASAPDNAMPVEATGDSVQSAEQVPYDDLQIPVTVDADDDGLDRLFGSSYALDLASAEGGVAVIDDEHRELETTATQCLAFSLGAEEYALNIVAISEIIKVKEFTDVPRAPGFVLGVISLRGVVVPVFDLAERLNLGKSELTTNSRIVVCQSGEIIAGLLVDSINQVIKLADDSIEPPPAVLSGLDRDFMTGVGRHQGRMVILLDVENVLNIEMR